MVTLGYRPEVPKPLFLIDHIQNVADSVGLPAATTFDFDLPNYHHMN